MSYFWSGNKDVAGFLFFVSLLLVLTVIFCLLLSYSWFLPVCFLKIFFSCYVVRRFTENNEFSYISSLFCCGGSYEVSIICVAVNLESFLQDTDNPTVIRVSSVFVLLDLVYYANPGRWALNMKVEIMDFKKLWRSSFSWWMLILSVWISERWCVFTDSE